MNVVLWLRDFIRSSLARKFALAIVIANIVLMALLGWELVDRDRAILDHHRLTRAEGVTNLLASGAAAPAALGERDQLQRLADATIRVEAVEGVVIRDTAGRVLAQAGAGVRTTPVTEAGPVGGNSASAIVSTSEDAFHTVAGLNIGGRPVGSVQVRVTRADILASHRDLEFFALFYGSAIILLGGLVAFLTARSVTERLRRLAVVADRFRLGEHGARFVDHRPDEVGAVSRGVNSMLDAIEESERSLDKVFRIAKVGAWRYFPAERRIEWSDTVHEIFGLLPAEPPPTLEEFLKYVGGRDRRRLAQLLERGESDQTLSFNFTFARPDGSRATCWAEARVDSCSTTAQRILTGICQDVTERESAVAQLRQAQKMEAVGQLTGGVAHDFNNLLAVMIGNLDLLEEQLADDPDARECVSEALAAALRGSELTRQLLAFSRRQSLSPQRIDLNNLVAGMSSLWRRTLGGSIEVRVHLAEQLWPTRADPTQVESAILNLVINARDAMPEGGTLMVETCNMSMDDSDWYDCDKEISPGDYSVIAVSDTGSGMPPEVVAQAFEPFFTTKAVGKGSGLGLSMVYGFARQSGGTVKIYSEPGHGTTVRLYLPREGDASSQTADQSGAAELSAGGHETVLVVEDNDAVRRIAKRQLTELGYDVVIAHNGSEALELLDQGLEVDLLFTDVVMPGGIDGFELGKLAMERRPDIKVLHTSGFARPLEHPSRDLPRSIRLLTKPYRKADLAAHLRELLDAPSSEERQRA